MSRRKTVLVVSCMLVTFALILGLNLGTAFGDYEMISGPYIKLEVSNLPTGPEGIWTVVEWQDPNTGEWAAVDGWQGTVETDGTQVWWVDADDYGSGPFRWAAFDTQGGEQLGLSDNFNLPENRIDVVTVQMQPVGQE